LTDPERGYYARRDPFGVAGDFITSPEISQMFGELIGLWAAATWRAMESPAQVNLVELGPGRGTMRGDVLGGARVVPGFRAALGGRRADHRLRPPRERHRRDAAGRRRARIRRAAAGAGPARSHRARGLSGAGAGGRGHGRAGARAAAAGRVPAPARHRAARGG